MMIAAQKLEKDVLTYLHNNFILIDKAMAAFRNDTLSDTRYIELEYFILLAFVIKRNIALSDIFSSEFKTNAEKLVTQKTQEVIHNIDEHHDIDKISLHELQDKRFPVYSRIFDCGYTPAYFSDVKKSEDIPMKNHFSHAIYAVSAFSLAEIATDKFASSEVLDRPIMADAEKNGFYHALFMRLEHIMYTFYEIIEDSKANYLADLRKTVNVPQNTSIPSSNYIPQPSRKTPESSHRNHVIPAPAIFFACVCAIVSMAIWANYADTNTPAFSPDEIFEATHFPRSMPELPAKNSLKEFAIPAHMTFYSRGSDVKYGKNYDDGYAPLSINLPEDAPGYYYIKLTPIESGTTQESEPYIFFAKAGHGPIELNICNGTYEISYATGKTWYGPEDLFGPSGEYFKCSQALHFYTENDQVHGIVISLYRVLNGNLSTDKVPYHDF